MNKIVEQNRAAIVSASTKICGSLAALTSLGVKNHQDYIDLTKDGVYNSSYVESKTKQINDAYHAQSWAYAPKISAELEVIELAWLALENALDVADAELASTMHIITAS